MAINTRPDIHELVVCANCFIKKDDKYLVLRRSKDKKYAPGVVHPVGGKVDKNEAPNIAAAREVAEETGIKIGDLRLEAVLYERKPVQNEPYDWMIFYFSADYIDGEIQKTDEGELIWLIKDQIKAEKLFPSLQPVIGHILDPQKRPVFATFEYNDSKQRIVKQKINFC